MKVIPLIWKYECENGDSIAARNPLVWITIYRSYQGPGKPDRWTLDWNGNRLDSFPTVDDARRYADATWLKRFAECVADDSADQA